MELGEEKMMKKANALKATGLAVAAASVFVVACQEPAGVSYDRGAKAVGYASHAGVDGGDDADVFHTYYINEFDTNTPYTYDNDGAGQRSCKVLNVVLTDVKYRQKNGKYWGGDQLESSDAKYNGSKNYSKKLSDLCLNNDGKNCDWNQDGTADFVLTGGKDLNPVLICLEGDVENSCTTDSGWESAGATGRIVTLNGLKNVTIQGVGESGATLVHYGFKISGCSNIIIRNLSFSAPYKDAIDIEGSDCVLIDHCSFSDWISEDEPYTDTEGNSVSSDGAIDIGGGSTNVTVSYNHFDDTNKNMLYSSGNYGADDGNTDSKQTVSVMYNWFEKTHQRNPMVRFGTVHVLNNFYDNVSSYGIDGRHAARILVEGNYFLNTKKISQTSFLANEIPSFLSQKDWGWEYGYPALIKLQDNYSKYNGEVVYPVHHGVNGLNGVTAVEVLATNDPKYDASGNIVARGSDDAFAPTTLDGTTCVYDNDKHNGAQSWDYKPPYEYVSMKPADVPTYVKANAGSVYKLSRPANLKAAQLLVSHGSIYSESFTSALW